MKLVLPIILTLASAPACAGALIQDGDRLIDIDGNTAIELNHGTQLPVYGDTRQPDYSVPSYQPHPGVDPLEVQRQQNAARWHEMDEENAAQQAELDNLKSLQRQRDLEERVDKLEERLGLPP